jgi:hypothetical protein
LSLIGLTGLLALVILNIAAFLEYSKYIFGVSNSFIVFLPAIKLLLNIDALVVTAIIFMYNAKEKVISPKLLFAGLLSLLTVIGAYMLAKDKPMALIAMLGLYGLGISVYATVIGFSSLGKKKTQYME